MLGVISSATSHVKATQVNGHHTKNQPGSACCTCAYKNQNAFSCYLRAFVQSNLVISQMDLQLLVHHPKNTAWTRGRCHGANDLE